MRYIYNDSKVIKFEVGKTYTSGRCDLEANWKVISRTEKTVTVEDAKTHDVKQCKIQDPKVRGGVEWCMPEGNFSKAPVLSADRKK